MEWVYIKDRLPNNDDQVAFHVNGTDYFGWFRKKYPCHGKGLFGTNISFNTEYFAVDEVDYWLPLPEPPQHN